MRSVGRRKMEATRNEGYGFYGTMRVAGCADEAWEIAMTAIAAETGTETDEVRDFLDSTWGRHFADTVHCYLGKYSLKNAIAEAIKKWNSWKLTPRMRRELDIPMPMPYLTGMVYVASFEAQACEQGV